MRWLTWVLLLALAAAAMALLLQLNAGNVAFLVPPWRLDVSLNLFLLALAVLLAAVYLLARSLQKLADFPERVRLYRARREEIGGQQALVEAARSLLEGRFARAEKAARAAQSAPATAAIAALIGARAAHRMQEYERRDEWLRKAESDRRADMARLVSSAEMWTEQRDNDAALGAIARLEAAGARHMHAMRIALNAYLQAGRWQDALKVVRVLEKRRALHPVLVRRLKLAAYRERLEAQRFDPASLEQAWNAIPAVDRANADVSLAGARLLNFAGRGQVAAAALEAALASAPSTWEQSEERLLAEYARAQTFPGRAQLERVEAWIEKAVPDSRLHAALLRTAGLLCLREQLWGKAASYFKESLRIAAEAATLLALARLAEATGDEAQATAHYREAALAYSRQGAADDTSAVLRESLEPRL